MKNKNIDILLINPGGRKREYMELSSMFSAIEPPIWAGLIAAIVRDKGFSARMIDADAENYSFDDVVDKAAEFNPLLIAISAMGSNPSASSTPKMVPAGILLKMLKRKAPHIKTALYGIHPSALAEETLNKEAVDFICKGECFKTLGELLKILKLDKQAKDYNIKGLWYKKDGKVVSGGWGELVENLDDLPFIAWDILPVKKYRAHNWHCFDGLEKRHPYAVIYTSLGCPYNCSFCNIHALYNGRPGIRFRSPKKVVDEIGFLIKNYNVKNIKILDELFVLNQNRVTQICDLIIERGYNLNIWAYARIDTVNTKLLNKMKQAGINWLAFGIESASDKVRNNVIKGRFDKDTIKRAVKMTHDAGIYIVANFIFGLPDDTEETMKESLDLAKELNCEYANFYTAMAYPGSKLYEDMVKEKVQLPESWLGYSQYSEETLPLSTKHLTGADVLRFRDRAFDEYHKNPRYIKMIEKKFGHDAVVHIKEMLLHKIRRKYA